MPGGKGCPMKKSKNKYSPWPAVALCLVFLALRIVDLALFTDLETSFPTVGPSAARWGTALVGAAALLVMGRRADEKIAPGRKSVLGVMMAVTGTVLVLAGLSQLLSATVVWPSMVLLTAAVIALLYWFFGTEQGSALRATGANQSMARAQGINTNTAKVLGLVVSNGLVALAGGLLAQYQGSATIDMGRGAIVIGLAAVIIGEVLLDKVFRNFALKLLSAVIGAIIYYVVITVVLRLGLESTDLKLLTALVVAVFLAVPYWKGRYFTKPVRKEGAPHA